MLKGRYPAVNGKIRKIQCKKENVQIRFVKVIGLSDGRVRVLLREMVSDGMIEKVGNNRYAYYILRRK